MAEPKDNEAHEHKHDRADHSHGLVDRSILRSRAGIRAVIASLVVLTVTALLQVSVLVVTDSVALLADLIHNFGDALTAIPIGVAFVLRSERGERLAGFGVVLVILLSACVALYESVLRFIDPRPPTNLGALAVAGVLGFIGNELAAQIRLRAGTRLQSPALIADGNHARIDGFVSLGVVGSASAVAIGLSVADPLIGAAITIVILKITLDSWRTVAARSG
ncbi:MAG: cation diffusion facilitator family transporter [Actinobacteria bacterium]|nr:cation diffusion facilitator family transporter [Actinomycetota bacterium]